MNRVVPSPWLFVIKQSRLSKMICRISANMAGCALHPKNGAPIYYLQWWWYLSLPLCGTPCLAFAKHGVAAGSLSLFPLFSCMGRKDVSLASRWKEISIWKVVVLASLIGKEGHSYWWILRGGSTCMPPSADVGSAPLLIIHREGIDALRWYGFLCVYAFAKGECLS
jgi:hypothetical protein